MTDKSQYIFHQYYFQNVYLHNLCITRIHCLFIFILDTIPCLLSPWSEWSDCSVTCGKGMRTRQRILKSAAELGDCNEELEQAEKCMLPECRKCGKLSGKRRRLCVSLGVKTLSPFFSIISQIGVLLTVEFFYYYYNHSLSAIEIWNITTS